jgi:tRNA-splicing ligase RtcB
MPTYQLLKGERVPIKAWVKGVPLEDEARKQLRNVATLPFIFRWVAGLAGVHWGYGATVGSVIPTQRAIIPAAVGVDIGCGMIACCTTLTARDLPDNLKAVRTAIEKAVPVGRTDRGGRQVANLPDADLAYFEEGAEHFEDYTFAVGWAQDYAWTNRLLMMQQILAALRQEHVLPPFEVIASFGELLELSCELCE